MAHVLVFGKDVKALGVATSNSEKAKDVDPC